MAFFQLSNGEVSTKLPVQRGIGVDSPKFRVRQVDQKLFWHHFILLRRVGKRTAREEELDAQNLSVSLLVLTDLYPIDALDTRCFHRRCARKE